jgi:holo-[acyl-carrier protein] synthase
MIFGIGTDIVQVARMQRNLDRFGDRFARRLLSTEEFADFTQSGNRAHFLARRFAAKEAAAKALGTGFADGVQLRDISVTHDVRGRPTLRFTGGAQSLIQNRGITAVHVSLADEHDHAVAFVTLETA